LQTKVLTKDETRCLAVKCGLTTRVIGCGEVTDQRARATISPETAGDPRLTRLV
jgi:hypothetical protein